MKPMLARQLHDSVLPGVHFPADCACVFYTLTLLLPLLMRDGVQFVYNVMADTHLHSHMRR
jgi:hypothetical protein